jgi:hypothetical protein
VTIEWAYQPDPQQAPEPDNRWYAEAKLSYSIDGRELRHTRVRTELLFETREEAAEAITSLLETNAVRLIADQGST